MKSIVRKTIGWISLAIFCIIMFGAPIAEDAKGGFPMWQNMLLVFILIVSAISAMWFLRTEYEC